MALILTLGCTSLWPVAIGFAFFRLVYFRDWTYKISWPVFGIAAILFVSAIYGENKLWPILAGGSVLICSVIAQNPPSKLQVNVWFGIVCAFTLILGSLDYISGATRVAPLHANASIMGVSGLAIPYTLTGALFTGFSLSRTALAGLWLFAILRNRLIVYALSVMATAIFALVTLNVDPARITQSGLAQSTDLRIKTVKGTTVEPILNSNGELTEYQDKGREIRWLGYGYAGYTDAVGRLQPHSVYVLSVFELGLLAAPFWICVGIAWWRSRNYYMLALLPLGVLVDDFYRLEGIYVIGSLHLMTRSLPSPVDNWRRFVSLKGRAEKSALAAD